MIIRGNKISLGLIAAFILSLIGHFILAYCLKRTEILLTFLVYFCLFACYVAVIKQAISHEQLIALAAGGIILRCIWLFAFPQLSDDYARFVWDGRLLANGHNPYFYLPKEIMRTGYPPTSVDPQLYAELNSQQYYTCYPPLLQLVFGISAWLFPHNLMGYLIVLRLFSLFAEAGCILMLFKLLPLYKTDRKNVLIYALNPLVIAELTGNYHYEGLVIFFLLATLYCIYKNRFWLSILLFTLSVITKLVPLIFLPVLLVYLGWRKGIIFCCGVFVLFLVSWLPFIDLTVMQKFWSSVDSFFIESEFNASIYYVLRYVVDYFEHENMIQINGPVLSILSALLIFVYAFSKKMRFPFLNLPRYFIWTNLVFLAFTTTVHPWYIIPMIAFATFTNCRFPIVWSAVIFLSYYTYHAQPFEESTSLLFIEYGAVLFAILYHLKSIEKAGINKQSVDT